MTLAATRTTSSVFMKTSLRAVFSFNGTNQTVSVDTVVIRNALGKVAHVLSGTEVVRLPNGAYECLLPAGLPEGNYTDTWSVRGISAPFKHVSIFRFVVSTNQQQVVVRE